MTIKKEEKFANHNATEYGISMVLVGMIAPKNAGTEWYLHYISLVTIKHLTHNHQDKLAYTMIVVLSTMALD